MSESNKFIVTMTVEGDAQAEDDQSIEKEVLASSAETALSKAINLIKNDNPEINHKKIWAWSIAKVY